MRRAAAVGGALWLLTGITVAADAAKAPALTFPIRGRNPYTAPITTVLDHSATEFYDPNGSGVLAYTGELASGARGVRAPYGYFHGQAGSPAAAAFLVNGAYVGTGTDGATILNYSGHAGYDYRYGAGTVIVAAADGNAYIPAGDAIYSRAGDPWCALHAFYIDHGGGWATWYLHARGILLNGGRLANGAPPHSCPRGIDSRIDRDEALGPVRRGEPIAIVGGFAHGQPGGVGYHLHFEVRRDCVLLEAGVERIHGCRVVDPYGWEGSTSDPFRQSDRRGAPHNVLAAAQRTPLWDLTAVGTSLPVVTAIHVRTTTARLELTIAGTGFRRGAVITLWRKGDGSYAGRIRPRQLISTAIVADLPARFGRHIGELTLKVGNPSGPRSQAVPAESRAPEEKPLSARDQRSSPSASPTLRWESRPLRYRSIPAVSPRISSALKGRITASHSSPRFRR
ncbi:MAG TPA: M23 family metallopeptidase [Steroidobacteraceae bacterium]|nr:M23 family metallopeptidase [Steroidobacteraceae bacterium]